MARRAEQEKSQGRGHDTGKAPKVDPEAQARQMRIKEHQEGCPRLSWAEEIRTILAQPKGFATLSTVSSNKKTEGFPAGSIVGFATDEKGCPFFVFSNMSTHTKNLIADPRASLCVTEMGFQGAADARVVLTGKVEQVAEEEQEDLKKRYIESHPNAFWATFGDFKAYRMDNVLSVDFVGGFARAGSVTPEMYTKAEIDPCLAFAEPVMRHMNDDHEESIKGYVQYLVGTGPVESAKMKRLDRLGFDVRVKDMAGGEGVLRVPFSEPVTERAKIKVAIMQLSKQCAELAKEQEEQKADA